tara:strand:+ start:29896 stop:31566 length:1671 start_codon:yes stop_codon:yes gene_type:complete
MKYNRKKTLKKSLKTRQSYKKKKSTRKKRRGGVAPPAPAFPTIDDIDPTMDDIRSTLQQISNPNQDYSYENSEAFINLAFDIFTDGHMMVHVVSRSGYPSPRDDTPLDDFFWDVIIPNFQIAVERDARHVDTIRRRLQDPEIRFIIDRISFREGAGAPRPGALRPSQKIQRYMDLLATLGDDPMDIEGGKRRKKKKSTRKKALKKKGGTIPRPQLKRETREEALRRMDAAHAEMERREEALRRERERLTTNPATPIYNRVRVALFDGLHGPPGDHTTHPPFHYVNVASQQLSNLLLVRGLQEEQISPQRTALQGILEDILHQFEDFITSGDVGGNQTNTYNTIQDTIRGSNISRVISSLQRSGSYPDLQAANVLREYIYGLIPQLDPSNPAHPRLSSLPSSSSSSLRKRNRGGRRRKTRRKTLKKKGGARPTPPEPLATPVMNDIMDNLQRYWINPELYPRYINEAFAVIGDINTIEALYREGELGYFFNSLIIDRFRNAIEHNHSNWDLIVNNIRTARTGRIVSELRERNIMASDVYQENIIRIGRLNPNLRSSS